MAGLGRGMPGAPLGAGRTCRWTRGALHALRRRERVVAGPCARRLGTGTWSRGRRCRSSGGRGLGLGCRRCCRRCCRGGCLGDGLGLRLGRRGDPRTGRRARRTRRGRCSRRSGLDRSRCGFGLGDLGLSLGRRSLLGGGLAAGLLGALRAQGFAVLLIEAPDDGGFYGRGGRLHVLTHVFQGGQDDLALDTELACEFVDSYSHSSPSGGSDPKEDQTTS